MNLPISVYALNLPHRKDRRASICSQFANKEEFNLIIYDALESKNGPWALWQNFYNIVKTESLRESEYFIFVEDDHVFTEAYDWSFLQERIREAQFLNADLLSGGMAVVKHPVLVTAHLFGSSDISSDATVMQGIEP